MNKKGRISLIVLSIIMFVVAIVAPLTVVLMNKNQEGGLTHPDWSVEDNVLAENFTFRYKLDELQNPYYEVVEYKGSATDVTVPSSFRDVPVKTIAKNAFSGLIRSANANIVSVQIPESITSIGANAFNSCTNLKYINVHGQTNVFTSSVTLGSNAFAGCKAIETLTVSTNASLGGQVWANNTSLRNVIVMVEAGQEAQTDITKTFAENFANASITTLTIDEQVTSIEASAFEKFTAITTLSLPATCEVGNSAFSNAAITSIEFTTPETAENIELDLHTFGNAYQNNKIANITLSNRISTIGANTFSGFTSLKNINLDNVTIIEGSAFAGCASLVSLNLQNVQSFGDSVFENCTALTHVTMPTLTIIPNRLFSGCVNLQNLTLPENLVEVGAGAFAETSIANVSITSGSVQDSAFANAHIQNLTISNVANIASTAFANATFDNVSIVVESGSVSAELLKQILTNNASASQITNVSITKNGITFAVQNTAISSSRATNIQTLSTEKAASTHIYQLTLDLSVIDATNPDIQAVLKNLTFEKLVLLNAPDGTITETIASNFTNSGVTSITFGEGVTKIDENAFAGNRAILELVEVSFADNIEIANNAFNGCANLYKVTFNPEKLLIVTGMSFAGTNFSGEKIGDFMVLGNAIITYLGSDEHIIIPSSGVSSISAGAFAGKDITSIEIPAGIQISYGAFDAENSIENVTILTAATGLSNVITYSIMQQFPNIKHLTVQNGVEYTGSEITSEQLDSFTIEGNGVITDSWANTFGENITKSLTISGYITEIASSENYVVWGSALTEIHVGSRVQTIGSNVFAKANNVATLNLQNAINLTEIGDEAFYNNAALTQIDFPTSLQTIGSKAFANATNLSVIAGGAGLQTIGDGAFEGTAWYANQQDFVFFGGTLFQYKGASTNLVLGKQLNISGNDDNSNQVELKRIASGAFKNNQTLETVTFTTDEIVLGSAIFEGCTNLKQVTINITDADHTWDKNVSNIFDKAFVETLIIGENTTKIVSTVLYNTNVQTLSLHAGISIPTINSFVSNLQLANVIIRDGGANQVDEDFLRAVNNNKAVTTLVLGENVNVANNAFAILKTVTNVTISHAAITENVFANSAVTHVTLTKRGDSTSIPSTVLGYLPITMQFLTFADGITQLENATTAVLSKDTFASLESISLPENAIAIGNNIFNNVAATTFEHTENVTAIGANAFANSQLTTFNTKNTYELNLTNVSSVGTNAFENTAFTNVILNNATSLAENALFGVTGLVDVKITYTEAENTAVEEAFMRQLPQTMQNLTLDNGLTALADADSAVFTGDQFTNLQIVTFPQNAFRVGNYAFANSVCANFENTEYITFIGNHAFESYTGETFTFGALQDLGEKAFYNATNLQSVKISSNLTVLNESVFEGCGNLQTVTISNVNTIANRAFYGCTSLKTFNSSEDGTLDFTNVTGIVGDSAFDGTVANVNIQTILLPQIQSVGGNAFAMFASATNLTIRNNASLVETSFTLLTQEGASGITNVTIAYQAGQETATVPFLTKLPMTMQSITFDEDIVTLGEIWEITNIYAPSGSAEYEEIQAFIAAAAEKGYQVNSDNSISVMGKYVNLSNVVFPNSLQNIGAGMFCMVNTEEPQLNVKNINIQELSANLQTISPLAFAGIQFKNLVIDVQQQLVLYGLSFWMNQYQNITFTGGGNVVDYGAFNNAYQNDGIQEMVTCIDLTNVTYDAQSSLFKEFGAYEIKLPTSLTEIPEQSFSYGNIQNINLDNVEVINSRVLDQNATIIEELNLTNLKTINDTNFQLKAKKIILGTQLHNVNITASGATAENISYCVTNAEDTVVNNFGIFMAPTVTIENGVTGIETAYSQNTASKIQVLSLPTENTITIGDSIFASLTETNFTIENIEQITSIGEGAFYNVAFDATAHETLNLPNCTYFGSGAFRDATGFTDVTFGTQVSNIGSYAFASSSFDNNIDFSNNSVALTIGTNAFNVDGLNVTSFKFANKNITFEAGVFDIPALTTIEIVGVEGQADLTGIVGLEYIKSSNVTTVILADAITSLQNNITGAGLFENMTNLVSVIANSIVSVPNNTFKNCTSLQNFTFDNIKYIGDSAFYNCTSLNPTSNGELNLQNVVALGAQAFYGMKNITSVVFGSALNSEQVEGITITIGEFDGTTFEGTSVTTYDFSACSSLTTLKNFTNNTLVEEIYLSSSIVNIADNAFDGCTSLHTMNLDNVQTIGAYAFRNSAIVTVNMQALTTLGIGAFYNCQQLATVAMPATLTVIPQDAFNTTTSLTSLTLPTQLTTIGASAFAASGVQNVNLPQTVTEIQANAFISSKLQTLSIYTGASLVVDATAFNNTQQYTKLSVLYGSKEILDTNLFQAIVIPQLTEIEIGENITTIEEGLTFSGMSNLTTVTLTSVENIAEGLFTNTALQTLKVANYVVLHMGAFDAYTNTGKEYPTISFVTTGTDITFVGSGEYTAKMAQCFANKTGLQSVTLQGFTAIANAEQVAPTFAEYVITNFYMPNVQTVGSYAFYEIGLTNVFLPAVTNIGASAFEASSIQGIYENVVGTAGVVDVPNLANIEQKAFYNTALSVLTNRNATVKSLADYAFSVLTQCGTEENALNFSGFTSLGVMELNASKVTFEASMTFNATWQEDVVLTEIAFNNSKTETVDLPIAFVAGVGESVESVTFTGNLMNIPANMFTAFTNPAFTVINLKNINSVGANAFANVTNLATLSVYVHNVIDSTAFAGCTGVNSLYIDSATANGILTGEFVLRLHENIRLAQTLTIGENITQIESVALDNAIVSYLSSFGPTYLNILGAVQFSENMDIISKPSDAGNYSVAAINAVFLMGYYSLVNPAYVIESIYAPNVYGALAIATQVNELTISSAVTQLYVGKSVYANNKITTIPDIKVGLQTIKLVDGDVYSSYNQENSYNLPYMQSFAVTSTEKIVETVYIKQAQEFYVADTYLKTVKTIGSTENDNYTYNMPFVEKVSMMGPFPGTGLEDNFTLNIPNAIRAQIVGMGTVNISSKMSKFIENIEVTGNNSQEYIMQLTGLSIMYVYTVNVVAWDEETQTTTVLPDVGNAEGVANFSSFSGNVFEMCSYMVSKKIILSPSFHTIRGEMVLLHILQSIETAGDTEHNVLNTYNFKNITTFDTSVLLTYPADGFGGITPVENVHLYLPNLVSYKNYGYYYEESGKTVTTELTIGAKYLMEHPNLGADVALLSALQKLHIYNGVEPIQLNAGVGASIIDNIIATSIRPNITELTFEGNKMFIYAADSAENGVFAGFTGITELDLANVETIGAYAFANCTGLTSVSAYLHNKLSTNAFVGCTNLTNLTIDSIEVNNGTIIIKNHSSETLTITKELADAYFITYDPETNLISTDKSKITSIQLLGGNIVLEGATSASLGVFANLTNLQSIDISGVTEIGAYAFANSAKLETLTGFNAQKQSIDTNAFNNCPLLPFDSVSYVETNQDTKLAKIYFYANNSTVTNDYINTLKNKLANILGQNYTAEIYFTGSNITLNDSGSGSTLFSNYNQLQKIYIGSSAFTVIPRSSFEGCENLTEIIFAEDNILQEIGNEAFANCYSLKTIDLPNSLTTLGPMCFGGCFALESVTIGENVTNIMAPFALCQKLTLDNIYIHENNQVLKKQYNCIVNTTTKTLVQGFSNQTLGADSDITSIAPYAFAGVSITDIIIPSSVISIGEVAFVASTLYKIVLPENLQTIGQSAFAECYALTVIINQSSLQLTAGSENYGGIAYYADVVATSEEEFSMINEEYIVHTATNTYVHYMGSAAEVVIPENANIGKGVFAFNNVITSVTIPENITNIGLTAFAYTGKLQNIYYNAISWTNTAGASPFSGVGIDFVKYMFDENTGRLAVTLHVGAQVQVLPDYICASVENITNVIISEDSQLTSIGAHAFYDNNNLSMFTLPAQLQTIGDYAFYRCINLKIIVNQSNLELTIGSSDYGWVACYARTITSSADNIVVIDGVHKIDASTQTYLEYLGTNTSVSIPEGIRYISNSAFYQNTTLTSVTIPASVTSIGNYAFYDCNNLQTVTFAEGSQLQTIGDFAFDDCSALTSMIIPASVTSIGRYAFRGCSKLQTVTFAEGSQLQTIGYSTFYNCSALTSITIPASVTSIGQYAFYYCRNLQTVTFTEGSQLQTIGDNAFYSCSALTSITIPASVTNIGNSAFQNCHKLQTVTFAEGSQLQTIVHYAFSDCSALTSITIPASVTSIFQYAFQNCDNIAIVINHSRLSIVAGSTDYGGVARYASYVGDGIGLELIDGVHWVDTTTQTYVKYVGTSANVVLPENITSIAQRAFYQNNALQSITIPASVTSIGQYAFYYCRNLQTVTFTEGSQLQTIGSDAFRTCDALTSITIPASVTNISNFAFLNCTNLAIVINHSRLSLVAGSSTYGYVAYYASYVGDGTGLELIDGEHWVDTTTQTYLKYIGTSANVILPKNITSIGRYAFYQNNALQSITIPASVTEIGKSAFQNCSKLQTVTFAEGSQLQTIGNNAFESCSALTSITIPANVTSIGSAAFRYCSELQTVTFAEGSQLKTIGDYAFYNCDALTSITIPASVTSIGQYAFYVCNKLQTVTFAEGSQLQTIGSNAFYSCSALTSITIPANVTEIGNFAFYNCNNLTIVINHSNLPLVAGSTDYGYIAYYASYVGDGTGLELIDGVHWVNTTTQTYLKYIGTSANVVLPKDITSIVQHAFYQNNALQSITIPANVTSIGQYAFYDCRNLQTVTFAEGSQLQTIGERAFQECSALTSITIPNSVTSIGSDAFYDCNNLQTVTFAEGSQLQTIGDSAFYYCSALTSITIPASVTSIGQYAFYYCSNLQAVTFAEGSQLQTIGNSAFQSCYALTSIIIPASVTSIGNSAFAYCSKLQTVTFAEGSQLQTIGDSAFYSCSALTSITIPASVTEIGENAFRYCDKLQTVTFAEGSQLQTIGNYAFYSCSALTSITIPANITSIGDNAFQDCYNLAIVINYSSLPLVAGSTDYGYVAYYASYVGNGTGLELIDGVHWVDTTTQTYVKYIGTSANVTLPKNITSIGRYAFYNNQTLQIVTIPASVTSIGSDAFRECSKLDTVTFAEGLQLQTIGDYAFQSCSALTSITILASVTSIGNSAFEYCRKLQIVTFAEGSQLQTIGDYAFRNCYALTSITIPNSVTSIGSNAFYDCNKLQTVTFAEGSQLQTIGNSAFASCSALTSITIPASVTTIGDYAFQSCNKLQTVTFAEGSQLQTIGDYAFSSYSALTSITIPASVTSIGRYAFQYCSKLQTVTFAEGSQLQTIGEYAFQNCDALTSITIPASVTSIGNSAFWGCSKLQTVTFAEGSQLQTIGDDAFSYCSALTSITIPANVTSIGNSAFRNCSKLQTVTFAEGSQLQTIGDNAFAGCPALTSITLPAGVTTIGNSAFWGCSKLETVTFAEGSQLSTIGSDAFRDCSALTSITITASVTSIGSDAFYNCNKLQTVTFTEGSQLQTIGNSAFYNCYNLAIVINHSNLPLVAGSSDYGYVAYYASYVGDGTGLELIDGEHWVDTTTQTYVKYIGTSANVILPENITSIGGSAFYNNKTLQSITIPASVTSIGQRAFYDCSNLQTVTFAEGSQLQTIGNYAFYSCLALTSITIPASVTSIGYNAFYYCYNLAIIINHSNLPLVAESSDYGYVAYYASYVGNGTGLELIDGEHWVDTTTQTYVKYIGISANVVLPENITSIPRYAFYQNNVLQSITIPASVTSIGYDAFAFCSNLQTVTFAEGSQLQTIGDFAFDNCSALTSITIPASVISIGRYAFSGCSALTSVTFEDPNHWFVATSSTAISGKNVTLTNAAQNATYLKSTYYTYYWKKSA